MIFDPAIVQQEFPPAQCETRVEVSVAQAASTRRAGRFAEAASIAACVLQLHPGDGDAWFELGAANAALDRRDEARRAFSRALDLQPANDDARLGLANLAWRDGDRDGARRWLSAISPARRGDPDVRELQLALDQSGRPAASWRIDAGAAYSWLTQDLPGWTEARATVSRREGEHSIGASVEYARHFSVEDVSVEVLATREFGPLVWTFAVGGAPQADFRPEVSARIGAEHYASNWYAGAAFTHAEYAVGPVDKLDLRVARDVSSAVRLRASAVILSDENDESRAGYGLGVEWRSAPGLVLDAGWSDAPESSDGITVDVRAAILGATFEVSPDLRVRAGLTHEMRGAYDRTEFSVGLARAW
jgi:YaiO family outer membrane protein